MVCMTTSPTPRIPPTAEPVPDPTVFCHNSQKPRPSRFQVANVEVDYVLSCCRVQPGELKSSKLMLP